MLATEHAVAGSWTRVNPNKLLAQSNTYWPPSLSVCARAKASSSARMNSINFVRFQGTADLVITTIMSRA